MRQMRGVMASLPCHPIPAQAPTYQRSHADPLLLL